MNATVHYMEVILQRQSDFKYPRVFKEIAQFFGDAEFVDSEQAEQIVESNYDVEIDDCNGVEENSVDTGDNTNYEKSKIISIIKKCLGLN